VLALAGAYNSNSLRSLYQFVTTWSLHGLCWHSPSRRVVHCTLRLRAICRAYQWSFRKAKTTGTLASQADIGVRVQTPGRLRESGGIAPGKFLRLYMQNPAIQCILAFSNFKSGNAVFMRSPSKLPWGIHSLTFDPCCHLCFAFILPMKCFVIIIIFITTIDVSVRQSIKTNTAYRDYSSLHSSNVSTTLAADEGTRLVQSLPTGVQGNPQPCTRLSGRDVHSSVHCALPFCSPFRCSWWFGRTRTRLQLGNRAFCVAVPVSRLEQSTTARSFGTYIINVQQLAHLFSRFYFAD